MKRFASRIGTTALIATVLVAGASVMSARASGITYYVDNGNSSCSDANSGDAAHPFCTISKAAAIATAGTTVIVNSGTYNEQVSVAHSGVSGSPIVLTAGPGQNVTVTGGAPNGRGFSVWKKSYVTINGFNVNNTSSYGFYVSSFGDAGSTHNIVISNNHVSNAGLPQQGMTAVGIYLYGVSDSLVVGNTTFNNTDNGIDLVSGTTNVTVSGNTSYQNASGWQRAANGIQVIAPNNRVLNNIVHDNEDSGIQIYRGGNGTLAADNVTYNNGDHGIDNSNVTGGLLIGNTVYHNCTSGINVEGLSTNYTIENNVAVDNAVYAAYNGISCTRGVGNIRVWDGSTSTTTADYNIVYLTKAGFEYGWGGPTSYTTLAEMQAASGQEKHGIQADPKWVDPSSDDFHLASDSPAIDSANSGVSGEQIRDVTGSGRVDDPDTTNFGAGPRTYDDRGAYEFDARPIAALSLSLNPAPQGAAVTADASASTDTDSTPIANYRFNFGDGTTVGPQTSAKASHAYSSAGSFTVTVTVTDSGGKSSQKSTSVTITPPNLVKNSGFESSTVGWRAWSQYSGCTLGRALIGHTGRYSAVIGSTNLRKQSCVLDDAPNWVPTTSAGTYTARVWVRGPRAGATVSLMLIELYGRSRLGYSRKLATLTTGWQFVTVTYTITRPGSVLNFNLGIYQGKGVGFYADDISITHP